MAKAILLCDISFVCGSYIKQGEGGGEKKKGRNTIGHLRQSQPDADSGKQPRLFCEIDTLFLSPSLIMLMAAADPKAELDKYVFANVFEAGERDHDNLVYRISVVVGGYEKGGERKAEWKDIIRVFKNPETGRHYGRIDALAVSPTVLMQLRKQKEPLGRELFLNCWMEKAVGEADAPPPVNDEDDIPF